ncbi:E3 ubiquitin-protein ligase ubr2, partial [Goodea atripinnis]
LLLPQRQVQSGDVRQGHHHAAGTHSGLCCRFRSADGCSVVIPLTAGGILLQVGASMMDPNHFLMIVLSRFELFHIFSSNRSDDLMFNMPQDVAQQNTLIEEMLHLIVMVVGERYVPGIGQVEPLDEVRREILHQLSIRPMAHSELVKALPENVRDVSVHLIACR